jgi:hypothetical protein
VSLQTVLIVAGLIIFDIASLGFGTAAAARAGKKHHDQKKDRGGKLVEGHQEKDQPAHRARIEEDKVEIKEDRASGG